MVLLSGVAAVFGQRNGNMLGFGGCTRCKDSTSFCQVGFAESSKSTTCTVGSSPNTDFHLINLTFKRPRFEIIQFVQWLPNDLVVDGVLDNC